MRERILEKERKSDIPLLSFHFTGVTKDDGEKLNFGIEFEDIQEIDSHNSISLHPPVFPSLSPPLLFFEYL